jgi:hypothetical protein
MPPQHGSLSDIAADGEFTYTASDDFAGQDAFSVVVSDGVNETPVGVDLDVVADTDDPPACQVALPAAADADGAYLLPAGRPARGRIVCSDDEGADLAFSLASAAAHGTVSGLAKDSSNAATFTYTPATGYLGADEFTIAASDGVNAPSSAVVAVRMVEPSPGAPRCTGRLHTVATPDGYEVEVGETVQGTIACFDPDGDALTFAVADPPGRGTLSTVQGADGGGRFTYTAGTETGADQIELVAADATQSSNVVRLDIDVVAAYDSPPACQAGLFTTPSEPALYPAENRRPNAGVISCVDDEGQDLTFDVTGAPEHGTLEGMTAEGAFASFAYVADSGYLGPDTATIRVRDAAGGEAVTTLRIDVRASANTAPACTATMDATLSSGAYTLAAGASATGQVTCTDAESDAITISTLQSPSRATLGALAGSGASRGFTVSAPATADGADTFVLRAVDALGAVTDVPVRLRIAGAPQDPAGGGGEEPGATGPGPGDSGPPPAGGFATDGSRAPAAPAPDPPRPPAAPTLRGLKLGSTKQRNGVRLTFKAEKGQRVTVVLGTLVKRKLVTVGRVTKRYARAGKQTLDVKLTSKGRAMLKRKRKLSLRVAITTSATGRTPTTVERRLSLRRR